MPAMSARVATVNRTRSDRASANSGQQRPSVAPLPRVESYKHQVYAALRHAIAAMDIYSSRSEIRLDERGLAEDFGGSRTPVREAMAQLEREGFVRTVPRRGVYVARKTKRQVIDLIIAWAALEGMAASLVTKTPGDKEIAALRRMFSTFKD